MRCLVRLLLPVVLVLVAGIVVLALLGRALDGLPLSLPGAGDDDEGRVERVVDGDTLVVAVGGTSERVRVLGIDTPETGACGARSATRSAARWVARTNDRVRLDPPAGGGDRDRYGRLLRTVAPTEGDDGGLASWQIDRGWARLYRRADLPRTRIEVLQAREVRARVARRGGWGVCERF